MNLAEERLMPSEHSENLILEHTQRYRFASQYVKDKIVLDAACGEGYGSDMLANEAKTVYGMDISGEIIERASKKYVRENLSYAQGSIEKLPFDDDSFDVVVSLETIEHVAEDIQLRFIKEIRRVLKADGVLIMSTPNKAGTSDKTKLDNKFHIKEFYAEEFEAFIRNVFEHVEFYSQYYEETLFLHKRGTSDFNVRVLNGTTRYEHYMLAVASARKITEQPLYLASLTKKSRRDTYVELINSGWRKIIIPALVVKRALRTAFRKIFVRE